MTSLQREISVAADSPRFAGHFPEDPVYPGVAQLLDWVVPSVRELSARPIVGVSRVKFLAQIGPGDQLSLTAHLTVDGKRVSFRVSRASVMVLSGFVLLAD